MGVCLVLYRIADATAERIRSDPPLVWLLLGERDAYLEARRRAPGLLGRLLGKRAAAEPVAPDLPRIPREDERCDLDKSWHALHFLLTGSDAHTDSPLSFLNESGERLCSIEIGYGPPEYRRPAAVREFAQALSRLSSGELRARYDAKALNQHGIYPSHWADDDNNRDYLGAHFDALTAFVAAASAEGQGILLQFT